MGDNVKAAKELAELIGLYVAAPTVSLFKLIKWLKGRKPENVTTLESGNILIQIDNSVTIDNSVHIDYGVYNQIEVRREVVNLYNDAVVRRAVERVVKPLERDGINKFEVRNEEGSVTEVIEKEELLYFSSVPIEPTERVIVDDTRLAALKL